jgi:hypothetical protein
MKRSGRTPHFLRTSSGSYETSFMVSTMRTWSLTSCAKSLSLLTMWTSWPASVAIRARVPITSSASKPETSSVGKRWVFTSWRIHGSCWRSSDGIEGRCALYFGYFSSRKVLPGASKITAPKTGFFPAKILRNISAKP